MDENSKPNASEAADDKAKELTPDELNKVAGGGAAPSQHPESWIEINSFQWGVGGE